VKLSERLAPERSPQRAAAATPPPPPSARTSEWSATKKRVHDRIVAEVGPLLARSDGALDLAAEVRARLDAALADVEVSAAQRRKFLAEVTADILGYGPLEPYLADATVTEVMVTGTQRVYVERDGRIEPTDTRFTDERQLRAIIDRIVGAVGRRVDESSPLCDARLPDGSRVNVVLPPLSLRGPALTIRKFPDVPMTLDDLVARGTLTTPLAEFLAACVRGKRNVLVAGGTGTGKTTLLNAVSQAIPADERVVTIEDAAELTLHQPHVVPMEARPANAEGQGLVTIRDLVRNALRMRPDRIVIGEVRGAEALDMLQAMNTGHEGSLTTLHANSPRDALSRLETMVLMAGMDLPLRAIRDQIAAALDLVVQLDRLPDGRRLVSAVTEVQGMEGDVVVLQDLFALRGGVIEPTGLRPKLLGALPDVPPSLFAQLPAAPRRRR
jgi:pilus assembly protein CpaF